LKGLTKGSSEYSKEKGYSTLKKKGTLRFKEWLFVIRDMLQGDKIS